MTTEKELLPDEFLDDDQQQLYEHFRFVVDAGQHPMRVDKYMAEHMRYSSRSRIQKAADAGYVHVNDRPVRSSHTVRGGDIITLMLTRPRHEVSIVPEDIPLDIVYEDSALLVVNKAAGMVVHPAVGNFTGTLVNALAYYFRDDPSYDADSPDVGLVHRIDKDTSGLLVVAKTPQAKTHLGAQFFNKTTQRSYHALVWGHLPAADGTIEGNISRDPKDRLRMIVTPPDSEIGKRAVTHYHVLERFGFVTLVECVLETGRTHQIRAHMRSINHPLFADERYGGMEILRGENSASYHAFIHNCFKLCPRQALHARTLGFIHPVTSEYLSFSAPLPADMQQVVARWRTYTDNKTRQ